MGVIGRYETHEQIGRGTMGVVYRARDTVLDRFVALKILRTGRDLDLEIKERFYREAKFGARLQHPNLAVIYDLGEADNQPFIAMELLQGADLRTYIEEKRPVPLSQKIDFLAQICDGIAYAHRQGVVHRDIKPSNIFIHEDRQPKILDFGIARLPTSTLTVAGNVLGTPNYMSPEQIQSRPCDARSDLFSAAIVFYEFLVYAHPFRSTFIPRRIAGDLPDSLYDHDPDIPPGLEELVMQGLAKHPEDRIQSAEAFATALRQILELVRSHRASEAFVPLAHQTSATPAPATPVTATPAEDDSRGRRVSEFMALSKDFDATLPVGDLNGAGTVLDQMRKLAADDALLRSSFLEYEERFGAAARNAQPTVASEEAPQARAAAAGAAAQRLEPRSQPELSREWQLPKPADQSLSASATRLFTGLETRKPEERGRETAPQMKASSSSDKPAAPIPPRAPAQPVPSNASSASYRDLQAKLRDLWAPVLRLPPLWRWVLVLALCVAVVLPLVALWPRHIIAAQAAIGQAVTIYSASVHARPQTSSKTVVSLHAGARVNVLDHVMSKDQQWIRVQPVSPAGQVIADAGYLQVADLASWSSNDARTAWQFLLTSEPAERASDQEIQTFANTVGDFGSRFPAVASDANLERARLYVILAQHSKGREEPASARDNYLQLARTALSQLPADVDGSQVELRTQLTSEIDALASADRAAADHLHQKQEQIKSLLDRIRALWEQGAYLSALDLVKQVKDLEPENEEAARWETKIRQSIAIEKGQTAQ